MLRDKSKNLCCSKCLKNSESKIFFENWWRPAEKTEIFSKHPVLFYSIIFIKFLSQFFWSSGQGSELQIQGSWVQTPLGKTWIFYLYFLCFFGQKYVYSILLWIRKDINEVSFIFWKYMTIVHLVLVQKWNFPFLSWTSSKWKTENMCWTVVKRPL